MKKLGIVTVIALAIAALFITGCKPKSPEQRIGKIFEEISEELDLSEVQKTQLLGIKDEIIEKGREMREKRKEMHEDLYKLILSDRIDTDEVKAKAKEKHAGMKDFFNLTLDRVAEFHATLTPEQKERLVDLMKKHEKKMRPPWAH